MATIAENLQIIKDSTDDIRQAILDKGGQITGGIATYAGAISNLASGESTLSSSDVNFYDYDGTLLHVYTKDEFLMLTSLPELPTQNGLICQGWNWNLTDAKTYVQKYGKLGIGATYITDDGKTRLYINLLNGGINVPLYINPTVSGGVIVDWGDGSDPVTIFRAGKVVSTHTYNEAGSYTISLTIDSGTCTLGYNSSSYNVMGAYKEIPSGSLYKVEIGSNMNIGTYAFLNSYSLHSITLPNSLESISNSAFCYCHALSSVTIPNSVASIGDNAFLGCSSLSYLVFPNSVNRIGTYAFQFCYNLSSLILPNSLESIGGSAFLRCYSLSSVIIPNSVKSISTNAFQDCMSLSSVIIPNSLENIGTNTFSGCSSLSSVTIPNSVKSIGDSAFTLCYSLSSLVLPNSLESIGNSTFINCYCIQYYDFTACTIIPTLSYTNAFTGINAGCEIRVPATLYEEWKAATNWSDYADYIVPYES